MKRRCVPLRADHNLLTPDTHTLSGVRLHPAVQVRSEVVATLSGHLSDSPSGDPTLGSLRPRPPGVSPTRRLRFEDETEKEVESRYLERQQQRRRVGQRGTGVLVSKPDLNLYINGKAGATQKGAEHVVNRQQRGRMQTRGASQCDPCMTVLGSGVNLNLCLHTSVPEDKGRRYRPHLNLRTEPIRETYIGSVTPGETDREGSRVGHVGNNRIRKRTDQLEPNGNQGTLLHTTPSTTALPVNPYAPESLAMPPQSPDPPPPTLNCSISSCHSMRLNGTKAGQNLNQNQEQGKAATMKPHRELQSVAQLSERSPCVEERQALKMKNSSSSPERNAEKTVEALTSGSSSEGQVEEPVRADLHHNHTSVPEHFISRDEPSRLSLRRLFSNVRLSRTRAGSLDRLSSQRHNAASDPVPSSPRKSSSLLKKTLSVQSLNTESSILELKKSSSFQSFGSEKKKKNRAADYRPAADQLLQRCLSTEDVGCPSSVRSVGRVLEVCSDGTFLLEISRPKNQMFGFTIGRGNGRPDSGVYVEDMVDSSTEKLYTGLLVIGDEILEVNGEMVAYLSLDQVTHLLTQNSSTTIRVLRHWKTPPR